MRKRFDEYRSNTTRKPRVPWGTEKEYGGIKNVSLPEELRPRTEPPIRMAKGHQHYSFAGDKLPGDIIIYQPYERTQIKKSDIRSEDQLLPKPPNITMNQNQIHLTFPAEHPYTSHINKYAMFPKFTSPDDPYTGVRGGNQQPITPNMPARPYTMTVNKKIRGSAYRHEIQEIPFASQQKGLHWPGEYGFYHYPKSAPGYSQMYYPTPPKAIAPNNLLRPMEVTVTERTANILKNIEKAQWLSTYMRDYTGNGSMNPIELDDYHEKVIAELAGRSNYFESELREQSHPTFIPNPPLRPKRKKMTIASETSAQCGGFPPTPVKKPEPKPIIHSPKPMYDDSTKSQCIQTKLCIDKEKAGCNPSMCMNGTSRPTSNCIQSNPFSDICMLRYKVNQVRGWEEPCAFYQHQRERMMEGCTTPNRNLVPLNSVCRSCNIQHWPHCDHQTIENKVPSIDISYEDLPQSRLQDYTAKGKPYFLNKPPSSEEIQRTKIIINRQAMHDSNEYNPGSGDNQPLTDCYHIQGYSAMEKERILNCDRCHLLTSHLKQPFSKTEAHNRYLKANEQRTLDPRDNVHSGRKHTFHGISSYYL
eukprot:gi/632965069/ref/XP_007898708.1/ PREDICTED: uncharacterized protein C7orf31 homolog isoform X2 [Callorhinchus milii]